MTSLNENLRSLPPWANDANEDKVIEVYRRLGKSFLELCRYNTFEMDINNPNVGFSCIQNIFRNIHEDVAEGLILCICSIIGRPICVTSSGIFVDISVDLLKDDNRAGGKGYLPLHNDLVNTEFPPDFVAIFCKQEDPCGGGQSIIGNIGKAISQLTFEELTVLSKCSYSDGKFFGLRNVGKERNPFPILEQLAQNRIRIRFTERLIDMWERESEEYRVLSKISCIIKNNLHTIPLKRGDLLVMNQNAVIHGKLPLGSGQDILKKSERRKVSQIFIRRNV